MADAGYSINPASTGAQGLENYLDQQQRNSAGGFRAPIFNIATGGSKLTPDISGGSSGINPWIVGGIAALFLIIKKKG